MALISCPECKKEISDQASVCPNCGYELKNATKQTVCESSLSDVETSPGAGIGFIILGIIAIIGGCFLLTIIVGIFAIIGGIGLISLGSQKISGVQHGRCPYCNNSVTVPAKSTTYKCSHCKRISSKQSNRLIAIE